MIVTVLVVLEVEMVTDDVVGVIAVRDRVVPARRAVGVPRLVRAARVGRRAGGRIGLSGRKDVLVDVAFVKVMEVTVVDVVLVALVLDGLVAARGAVLVVVLRMNLVIGHDSFFLVSVGTGTLPLSCERSP